MTDRDLTAFCGLWCNDCIPSNEKLYSLTSELHRMLAEIGFENYAAFKSKRVAAFGDYETFLRVLNAFEKLHCYHYCRKGPCSEAGCAESCQIRVCVLQKGLQGCWDCGTYESCAHIERMGRFHPDIKHNLAMIREHGIDNWKADRKSVV
jgi:hypothetical protein